MSDPFLAYAAQVVGGPPEDIADWQAVARDLFQEHLQHASKLHREVMRWREELDDLFADLLEADEDSDEVTRAVVKLMRGLDGARAAIRDSFVMSATRHEAAPEHAPQKIMRCADERDWPERTFNHVGNGDYTCSNCGWAQSSFEAGCYELVMSATWHSAVDYVMFCEQARRGGYEPPALPVSMEDETLRPNYGQAISVAKHLVEDGSNAEYTRGIAELIADLFGYREAQDMGTAKVRIATDLGLPPTAIQ